MKRIFKKQNITNQDVYIISIEKKNIFSLGYPNHFSF